MKVVFEARRPIECDFRCLYSILKTDSSEVTPDFELFPGFLNLRDTDGDGIGDEVIDPIQNDGQSDSFVGADETQYREYTYSIDDLLVSTVSKLKSSSLELTKRSILY